MQRVLIYSHDDQFLSELVEADVSQLRTHTKLNGEHCLTISTRATLVQGQRILTQDGTGKWYEWVVTTADDEHTWGTYECDWSLQNDLQVTQVSRILTDKTAREAISAALSGTQRWGVGTVNVAGRGSASMYKTDGWSALSTAVETWGGEVDAEITVNRTNVVSRSVSLLSHLGQSDAVRRFDYGHDLRGIRRVVERYPRACRIVPLGKGEETEEGGYGRKITIESVNDGIEYLQNDDVVELLRLPDGSGGWEYPTIYVENPDIEEPQALLEWGQSVLGYYTMPMVTYEADVMQLAMVGMDVRNISLGDVVQCVDREFRGEGLRIEGRVVELDVDGIDPSGTVVTIGHIRRSIASELASRVSSIGGVIDTVISTGVLDLSERYVRSMLDRINEEANLTGGYTYITEGQGIRTYDKAVSDPLVGDEANAVVEIKGGTVRIANSRTSSGDWDWKSVFVSGHILAELVTAARLTAGSIGSPSGNYWNLDTGELRMASVGTSVDGTTLTEYAAGIAADKVQDFVDGDYADDLEAIAQQVDGKAETWYQASDPSSSWTADQKAEHAGDLWYKTANGENTTWRWDGSQWVEQYAPKEVFDAIDGKMQVFTSQPTPPYEVGDLWVQGSSGDLKHCVNAKGENAQFSASDWSKSTKYTDDSAVSALDSSLDMQNVFNRLTNNGQAQGLYIDNGQLYINGSYIKSGTIDAGYITAGVLSVKRGRAVILSANLTSGTATIGGFTVSGSALYSGKTSLTSNTSGIYISTSGISVGSGSAYTALAGGYLRGGSAGDITGYVGFNNYWTPTGVYGTRLAGRGCIALLTNGAFGIGSYYAFGSDATITTGQSGTMQFIERIQSNDDGTITWWTSNVTFTKGLMTTVL